MLTGTKEQKGDTLVVQLSGTIDEADDFGKVIGQPSGPVVLFCKQVTRINSVGVKGWMKYFLSLTQKKIPVTFEEFSVSLVEQVNMVQNFLCGGTLVSVVIPFRCSKCQTGLVGVMKTADLVKIKLQIPAIKCPKCAAPATFDDVPEEYFSFLERPNG